MPIKQRFRRQILVCKAEGKFLLTVRQPVVMLGPREVDVLGVVFAYNPRRPMAIVRPGDGVCGAGCPSAGAIIVIGRFSEVTWPWKGTSPGSPWRELDANIWFLRGKTETALARNRRFESSSLR